MKQSASGICQTSWCHICSLPQAYARHLGATYAVCFRRDPFGMTAFKACLECQTTIPFLHVTFIRELWLQPIKECWLGLYTHPSLYHVICGLGAPWAWHGKVTLPPTGPITSDVPWASMVGSSSVISHSKHYLLTPSFSLILNLGGLALIVHTVAYRLADPNRGSSPSSTQKQEAQTLLQKHANTSCHLGFSYLLICNLITWETVSFNIPFLCIFVLVGMHMTSRSHLSLFASCEVCV